MPRKKQQPQEGKAPKMRGYIAGAGEIERLADQADQNEPRGRHRPKRKLEKIHRPGAGKMGDEAKVFRA